MAELRFWPEAVMSLLPPVLMFDHWQIWGTTLHLSLCPTSEQVNIKAKSNHTNIWAQYLLTTINIKTTCLSLFSSCSQPAWVPTLLYFKKKKKKNSLCVSNELLYTLLVMHDVISLDIWIDFGCWIDFSFCRQGNHKTEAMQKGKGRWGHWTYTWPLHTTLANILHVP